MYMKRKKAINHAGNQHVFELFTFYSKGLKIPFNPKVKLEDANKCLRISWHYVERGVSSPFPLDQ